MEAFYISVIHSDKLNFHNYEYCENGELSIGVSGRLIHREKSARLQTRELAEQYKNAIHAKRLKAGDLGFEAKVERVLSDCSRFISGVKSDSELIRHKLEKWKYPTPEAVETLHSSWIIRIQIEDNDQEHYLRKLGTKGTLDLANHQALAKQYKKHHFVQKALLKINSHPKLRAFAVEVKN
ncbi:hypothetical protein [Psychromonas aquimarina]|uniref:hypothetical protein n=1 Tax=Psychromonas aquimarina TaxID=444919 RepID=UPI0003F6CCA0|nr:hypothetical protein [Psychromonas aquimarina]